jgi:hypothetical protein
MVEVKHTSKTGGLKTKLALLPVILFTLSTTASAYTIDGNLDDWGVNLTAALEGNNSAWQPTNNNVDWIAEDNIDPTYTTDPAYPDWTGYNKTGTHIKKSGNSYTTYNEPTLPSSDWWARLRGNHYLQPVGGEHYDIEALYFDDDPQYVYIAIVTSMPPEGYTDEYNRHVNAGDIAIDLDNNPNTGEYGYEYGIKTHGANAGMIRHNPDWSMPQATDDFIINAPSEFNPNTGNYTGTAELTYKNAQIDEIVDYGSDKYKPNGIHTVANYIIEAKIPKNAIGNPTKGQLSNIHITIGCGNDVIELRPVTFNTEIPEFPQIAIPTLSIITLLYLLKRKQP